METTNERHKGKLKNNKNTSNPVNVAFDALEDKKGQDISIIDLDGKSSMADALVIATSTSERHSRTLADNVPQALEAHGFPILGVEGLTDGDWVLVDTGDIIVHIFTEEARELYNLEKMWSVAFDDEEDIDEAV